MMKKYISIICITLAIVSGSCKKTYLDELKENPNSPSVASPPLLLSGSLKTSAGILNGAVNNTLLGTGYYIQYACWMGYLSWSVTFQPNLALDAYQFTTVNYDVWSPLYLNISNYNALMQAKPGANYTAIAKIMTVVDYQQIVDNYNNAPYSQALQGTKNLAPAYDSGTAIYDDLLKQLDAAIALIQGAKAADANPGTADIMYGGNMTNWIKYANTLKLRLAIRQTNITAKTAALKAAVAATASLGYIDNSNPALINPGYSSSDANGGQQSPVWLNLGYTQSGAGTTNNQEYNANQYAINFFNANNDPRLKQVYAVNPSGNVVGSFFGATTSFPTSGITPSVLGPGVLKSAAMPATMMSSAESFFLQAEGAESGYITGDPAALYNAGVTASFVDDGLTAAQATTYLAQAAIAYPTAGTAPAKEKAIIVQKWAALFGYGPLEAYNEFRRTGYPDDIPLSAYPNAGAPNQVTRIFYPTIEFSANSANVAKEGTINIFTSKIFWAK